MVKQYGVKMWVVFGINVAKVLTGVGSHLSAFIYKIIVLHFSKSASQSGRTLAEHTSPKVSSHVK